MIKKMLFIFLMLLPLGLQANNDIVLYDYVRQNGYFYDNPALTTLATNGFFQVQNIFQAKATEKIASGDDNVSNYLNNNTSARVILPLSPKFFIQFNANYNIIDSSLKISDLITPGFYYLTNTQNCHQASILGGFGYKLKPDVSIGYYYNYMDLNSQNKYLDPNADGKYYWQADDSIIKNMVGISWGNYAFSLNYNTENIIENDSDNNNNYQQVVNFSSRYSGFNLKYFEYNQPYLTFLSEISYEHRLQLALNTFDTYYSGVNFNLRKDIFNVHSVISKNFSPFMLFAGFSGTYQTFDLYDEQQGAWQNDYNLNIELNAGAEYRFLQYFKFYLTDAINFYNSNLYSNTVFNNALSGGLVYQINKLEFEIRGEPIIVYNKNASDTDKFNSEYQLEFIIQYIY